VLRIIHKASVVYDGVITSEILEALACSEALTLAEDMYMTRMLVASNCLNIIKDLNEESRESWHCMIISVLPRKTLKQPAEKETLVSLSHDRPKRNS
jgi:hypothetical protein